MKTYGVIKKQLFDDIHVKDFSTRKEAEEYIYGLFPSATVDRIFTECLASDDETVFNVSDDDELRLFWMCIKEVS